MAKAPVLLTFVLTTFGCSIYIKISVTMKFSSSATHALHPTFFSHHPDDNGLPVDFFLPSLMNSSYSQDDGADNLPLASIPAAAMDHIVDCNDAMTKKLSLLIVI